MPRKTESAPLMRCGELPCPWMENVRACPHRVQADDRRERLRYPLCRFFSMPGPHAPSKIAKVCGLSVDTVNDRLRSGEQKMREMIAKDPILSQTPGVAAFLSGAALNGGDECLA